jgi:hypothetical protein
MPIDPSIALSFKPAQFADPLEAQARRQQIQSNALAMRSQQSALERQNMLSQRFAQGGDFSSPEFISDIMKIDPDKGMQLQQFGAQMGRDRAAMAVSEADLAEKNQKIARRKIVDTGLAFMNALGGDASDEHITQVGAQLKSSGYSDEDISATLQPVLALPPAQRKQAIRSQILQTEEGQKALALVLPKIEKIDTGGKIIFRDVNPDSPTFKEEFGSIAKTATPDAIMAASSSAARLAQDAAQFTVTTGLKREELGQKGKEITAQEGRTAFLSSRIFNAATEISDLTTKNPDFFKKGMWEAAFGGGALSNFVNPAERQIVSSAIGEITDAALTLGTGAAYTREQIKQKRNFYEPAFTDKPETVQIKKTRFKQLMMDTKKQAGEAWTPEMDAAVAALFPPPPAATPKQTIPRAGTPPKGVDQKTWDYMTPQERKLWPR